MWIVLSKKKSCYKKIKMITKAWNHLKYFDNILPLSRGAIL